MKFLSILGVTVLFLVGALQAQELNTPAPSPMSTITQVVGLTDVTVTYSRPGVKGREIFGGLVPYGELWRTGANKATTLKISDDIKIEGIEVPAGEYALFTIPEKDKWTIIISKNIGWGTNDYKKEGDVARFMVNPVKLDQPVERFTIEIADVKDESARFVLRWDKTQVSFGMTVDTDSKVMSQIDEVMKNKNIENHGVYFSAADYYYSHDKDLKKALTWVNKAIDIKPDAFWIVRLKSQIQAKMEDYKAAIETAKVSLELAEKANNKAYVRFNKEAIAGWEKKLRIKN